MPHTVLLWRGTTAVRQSASCNTLCCTGDAPFRDRQDPGVVGIHNRLDAMHVDLQSGLAAVHSLQVQQTFIASAIASQDAVLARIVSLLSLPS